MDAPLRRSRRLEGLQPEAAENLAAAGRARRAPDFQSGPKGAREPGPGSPRRPAEGSPGPPSPERAEDAGPHLGQRRPDPGSPPRPLEARPEAPHREESPGSPEPAQPAREQTPRARGSSRGPREPREPPPAADTATGCLGTEKRHGPSPPLPASKRLKGDRQGLPVIPKGKPKSGRVWKDRSKKR